MGSSILQICQDASDEPGMGLARPATLFAADNNGNDTDRKLLRSLARAVAYLAGTYDWQTLRREMVFAATATEDQPGAIAADFLRFVPETFWNRTNRWRLDGPKSPAECQSTKAWYTSTIVPSFCQRGGDVLLFPVPNAGIVCSYEYISNAVGYASQSVTFSGAAAKGSAVVAVSDTTGLSVGMTVAGAGIAPGALIAALVSNTSITLTTLAATTTTGSMTARTQRTRFAADTDTTLWDDELMIAGIVWQYRKGERFDFAQDQADFMGLMADRLKQDGGRKTINMRGRSQTADQRLAEMRSSAVMVGTPPTWGGSDW